MDVAALNGPSPQSPSPASPVTHVSFDAGAEFNLSFFDSTDDVQGLSDAASDVGSASPPPTKVPVPVLVPTTSSPPATVLPSVKQDQQFAAADSNSSGHAKAFVPCKVCGDKASGYHYGVTSCEGCKGFFRRSIQKQIEYRCLRDGKCLVIRLNRNRCQFCRFRKCLAVGMSRDSVRYGRVPKRSRERPNDDSITVNNNNNNNCSPTAVTSPTTTPVLPSPMQQPLVVEDTASAGNISLSMDGEPDAAALLEITASVTAAYTAHCNYSYTDEATRTSCPRTASPDSIDSLTLLPEQDGRKRVALWQTFASLLTPCVQRVVEFAKRVPGFCELGQDDQLILIKLGFLEVWMVQTSCLASESGLTLWDGTLFSQNDFHLMYGPEFANALLSACSALAVFPMGDAERALAAAAVLLWPERPGLSDAKAVRAHHNRVVAALRLQLGRQGQQHLAPLLSRLGDIRAVGSRHAQRLDWLREQWPVVRLPPLFSEIFDIPKAEGEEDVDGDMEGEVDDSEERDPGDDVEAEVDLDTDEVDGGRREDGDVEGFEARRH